MPISDLKQAYAALSAKQAPQKKYFEYYDGEQPIMYATNRLVEVFKDVNARFTQNWCAVVIDSVKDRINLRNVRVPAAVSSQWKEQWLESELFLESDDCHEAMLVGGEGFVIVDNDGQAYYNDPRQVQVFYDAARPRVKKWACKWWVNEDEKFQVTLYYPNSVENYISRARAEDVREWTEFEAMPGNEAALSNPLRTVPVFHFRQGRRRAKSDLVNVLPIQNGINKLLADMMVAAEFGAFKQRWVISNVEVNGKLKNAPSEIWDIPAGDGVGQQTEVGQFEHTPLDNYLTAIEQMSNSVSSITRTPKHYFFSIGSNLSGEALMAMESPLVKKAQDRIDRCEPVWRAVTALMIFAKSGKVVLTSEIEAEFDKSQVVQPRTEAETRGLNVQAGMPLVTALRDEGKSPAYIEQMLKDKEDDSGRQEVSLAQGLLSAQRRFDKGGGSQGQKL
jgi:hypothetical protein